MNDIFNNDKILIVALPFAGGNSYSYNFLKPLLSQHVLLETLEYPGRGKKSNVPLVVQMDKLTDGLLQDYLLLIKTVQPRKVVLYGHSIGAVIGLSLLHLINKRVPRFAPGMAIFSGHGGPRHTAKKILSSLPDTQLLAHFKNIGSLSSQVAADRELMDYVLPILRNDLMLYENHHSFYPGKLTIPLAVLNGKKDNIFRKDIASWALETTGNTEFYELEGHHFFMSQFPHVFSDLLLSLVMDDGHKMTKAAYSISKDGNNP